MTIYTKNGESLLYEKESYVLRGIFMEICNELGPGLKESVYVKALMQEFKERGILFENEKYVKIVRKGEIIGRARIDFVVWNKIIVEVKALEFLPAVAQRQLQSYLSGSEFRLGFLVNFGGGKLEIIRKINDKAKKSAVSS